MNSAIPNRPAQQNLPYIASIRFMYAHRCCGVIISQDHVGVLPGCFYDEQENLIGALHLYEVWIPIPYNGNPGRFFTIAGIHVSNLFPREIAVLLVSHYTKN